MKLKVPFFFALLLFLGCSQTTPRRPIDPKPSTTVFQENIEVTKQLFQQEEKEILQFIKKDSLKKYESSANAFWYTYKTKVEEDLQNPKEGDLVTFTYNISTLNDNILYTKEFLGIQNYKVDKEDFISGIQKGIKLMKKGETVTFVIPSYNAFGVAGDGKKIGVNQTIKSTVTLININ
ncbi:gliding motility-associated peptidyl-prolyl isomerase GldI [uncultured Polaribacter sp.]|uniref:gliding motility-associated peptidyl-prolyl isomerase GldI n=1 Tax=uncultured Polaribacter sp. TaxID=174711 RepID=UPI00262CB594|nr:gliding motility-associated peptidyl-prolyl isomerase GldI [uncultured Polaribacter sp.]